MTRESRDFHDELDELAKSRPALPAGVIDRAAGCGRATIRRRRTVVIAAAASTALLIVSAALLARDFGNGGDEGTPAPAVQGEESGLPVLIRDGEPYVSCGGGNGWPASVMQDGLAGVFEPEEARATFADLLADPQFGAEAELSFLADGVDTEYRVLRSDTNMLVLGLGDWTRQGPAQDAFVMDLVRENDRWQFSGGGSCGLRPVLLEQVDWAQVSDPRVDPADPGRLTVSVNENQCTGGRDPAPFLRDPVVVEAEDFVTVYWTTEIHTGRATCQGNPSIDRSVELDTPLGSRQLLDGSVWPPRPVGATPGS